MGKGMRWSLLKQVISLRVRLSAGKGLVGLDVVIRPCGQLMDHWLGEN